LPIGSFDLDQATGRAHEIVRNAGLLDIATAAAHLPLLELAGPDFLMVPLIHLPLDPAAVAGALAAADGAPFRICWGEFWKTGGCPNGAVINSFPFAVDLTRWLHKRPRIRTTCYAQPAASAYLRLRAMSESPNAGATGRIAARIDRLPLTWVQWRLALITQIFWGIIIAADGIPAKLYPFVWAPRHSFGAGAFSVLLAVQFGVGILVGEYLIGIVADRWGRRTALLASSLSIALLIWPTALTNNFWLLLLFFGLSSLGMGGVLSTNVVYMGEIVPPRERGRVMLASQVLAVLVFGALGNVPGLLWVPGHYQWFIVLFAVVPIVVLVPLVLFAMPESPRWLEAHGHHAEAERVIAALEMECLRRSGVAALPEPDHAQYTVPVSEHVPMQELFRGEYGQRTVVLLAAWILGYSGIVYGFAGYEPALLESFGLTASQTFGVLLVSNLIGGCLGLAF